MKTAKEWLIEAQEKAQDRWLNQSEPELSWRHQNHFYSEELVAAIKGAVAEERARWMECAKYDATVPKPLFRTWDRSALDRLRVAIEKEMEEKA